MDAKGEPHGPSSYLHSGLPMQTVSILRRRGMSQATAVSTVDFDQEVLGASVPVIVDFWAPWCGPCRRLGPELDAVAASVGEKAKVVKVNIDENPELAEKYGVRGIPNLIIFQGGKAVDQIVGLVPRTTISSALGRFIAQ